jgi:hypothetical protein
VKPDVEKLTASLAVFALVVFLVVRGLATGQMRSRFGVVFTAKARPFTFYTTIVFYVLVACILLSEAIRSAGHLLAK